MSTTQVTPLQRLEVLKQARSLIAAGFCQGDWAQDRDGKTVGPNEETAVKFCAEGARQRACGLHGPDELFLATRQDLSKASCLLFLGAGTMTVNDEKGQDAVLQMYDFAIKGVEKELS